MAFSRLSSRTLTAEQVVAIPSDVTTYFQRKGMYTVQSVLNVKVAQLPPGFG